MSDRPSLEIRGPTVARIDDLLTAEALDLIAALCVRFEGRRRELLHRRAERQAEIDAGRMPEFLAETRSIREAEWSVADIPADLEDRRVEITGPAERKTILEALRSGANVFMADFEDAHSPTWRNVVTGQLDLRDAVRNHRPRGRAATLMVRPRGWQATEKHVGIDGEPVSASLFDFGLFLFHNAEELLRRGSGPYFYLPKLEGRLEARLWNDVFIAAQELLGLPRGTIRATVLIETILSAFEMDEILYELREHSAGLNCGRWDYIFSIIKRFRNQARFLMPDRDQVTMTTHGLRSYSLLAIQTCHRRGVHAIGGMAAQIPVQDDADANRLALDKIRADKDREAGDGHDGTWVAHPGLVSIARSSFDARMPRANQIDRKREDVHVTAHDLLAVPRGSITERGLRHNLDVGIQYLGSWLAGSGCVPIYDLMEDAATAEVSRAQVWQWIHHREARLDDGREINAELCRRMLSEELAKIRRVLGDRDFEAGRYRRAAELIEEIVTREDFEEFMTAVCYRELE